MPRATRRDLLDCRIDLYDQCQGLAATLEINLADFAGRLATQTTLDDGLGCTTTDLKIAFLRPMTANSEPLRCEGSVCRLVLGEARLRNAQDKLCAHTIGTCMLVETAEGSGG